MGNIQSMATMDRLCDGKAIWYHQSPATHRHMMTPPPLLPLHPAPFALTDSQQLLNSHMFPVIGVTHFIFFVWPPLLEQWHSSCSTCLQILICPTSSVCCEGGGGAAEERNKNKKEKKMHKTCELPLKRREKKTPTKKSLTALRFLWEIKQHQIRRRRLGCWKPH